MKRPAALLFTIIMGVVLMAGASLALADNDLTGNWSGSWTCPEGEIKNGKMHGNIQQSGSKITGQWTMQGTVEGDISGPLSGNLSGNTLVGDITAGSAKIHIDCTFSGNTANGNYSSPIGNGQFKMTKQ